MNPNIDSIQIGTIVSEGDHGSRGVTDRFWTTGFYKTPVHRPVRLTRLGIIGDAVADTRNHGGPDKAVLCYAAAHYRQWALDHPGLGMSAGGLGENLTIAGADETTVCVGDRFRVGRCVVQVSQPRQPCWKIARRWGVKTLTKEVAQSGRTGWYVRVLEEGMLETGQTLELIERAHPEWTISRLNDVLFGREVDRMAVVELMNIGELSESWKQGIA